MPDQSGFGQAMKLAAIAVLSALVTATLVILVGEALIGSSGPIAPDAGAGAASADSWSADEGRAVY